MRKTKKPKKENLVKAFLGAFPMKQRRIIEVFFVFAILLVYLIARILNLQVIDAADQYARQIDQLVEEVPVQASRGNIYDRNMNVLVQDSSASAVNVIPLEVEDTDKLADALSEKLSIDRTEVVKKITRLEDDSVEVKQNVRQEQADTIMQQITKGISFTSGTLYAVPDEIEDAQTAAQVISSVLNMNFDDALEPLTRKESNTVLIQSKVDNTLAKEIQESQAITDEEGNVTSYNGVELVDDKRRYYTNGEFAAYVLGFTGQDHNGLFGVEASCDDLLSGENGILYLQKDAKGNQIPSQSKIIRQPTQGEDVVLTIDSYIQTAAERSLKTAVEEWEAKSGTVIVMDTETGEILTMASYPSYDLDNPYTISDVYKEKYKEDLNGLSDAEQQEAMWRNPAVSFVYEPGSTFKAITSAAALEEGVVTPETTVYCSGSITVDGVTINCTGNHGTQTVSEAIANSCNPGLVQIIEKLDPELFYQYIYNFGFGETTGIELTGEEAGIVNRGFDEDGNINMVDYATYSFGQGLATTPIQLLSALNAVVNDGYYMNPTLIKDNSTQQEYINGELNSPRQLISQATSAEMRNIMQQVVDGDVTLSQHAGDYSIGGKTGTAEQFVDGSYSDVYVTSFFCYAPVEDPKYSMIFLLNEPKSGAFGGTSAGPYAIDLMKQILDYSPAISSVESSSAQGNVIIPDLVGQEKNVAIRILEERGIAYSLNETGDGNVVTEQSIEPKSVYEQGTALELTIGTTGDENNDKVTVPDLSGMSIQAVNELVTGLGLNLKVEGSGFATSQSPAAGTEVDKGSDITVTFSQ